MIARRVEAFSPESQAVLRQASVLGNEFDREILRRALGAGVDLEALLHEAVAERLLERAPTLARYRFPHDLIRETLDASASPTDRAVRTGTTCTYLPEFPVVWQLD